jgi:hypothetical protein
VRHCHGNRATCGNGDVGSERHDCLSEFDFSGNGIRLNGIRAVAAAINGRSAMRALDLSGR